MTLRRFVLALAGAMLATLAPTAAQASYSPSVWYALADTDSSGGEIIVQVNAPAGSWAIRQAARRLDAQVPGVTVRTSGDCKTADVCVDVVVRAFSDDEQRALGGLLWRGLTTGPTPSSRVVYLNSSSTARHSARDRAHVAAHEMGHVFGLAHHRRPGVMSEVERRWTPTFSAEELAVLATLYPSTS